MTELPDTLAGLNRPRLLVSAARKGLAFYRRERDLGGLVGGETAPARAARALLAAEARLEQARTCGAAAYSAARHIAVLTALLAEARGMAPGAA